MQEDEHQNGETGAETLRSSGCDEAAGFVMRPRSG